MRYSTLMDFMQWLTNIPVRKTDVMDSRWEALERGLSPPTSAEKRRRIRWAVKTIKEAADDGRRKTAPGDQR
jgi:hypothetical protein